MQCPCCGKHVALDDAEPTFGRPDAWVALSAAEQARGHASSDLCVIHRGILVDAEHFVRAVVPFTVRGRSRPLHWGLWVKVSRDAFLRIVDLWHDPDQHLEPAKDAELANRIPGYADTLGLPCSLQLRSPRQRPSVTLATDHELAAEQRAGVQPHRAGDWLRSMLH
jgi:hypothetical protein